MKNLLKFSHIYTPVIFIFITLFGFIIAEKINAEDKIPCIQSSASVSLNKSSYNPGETMTISGNVTYSNASTCTTAHSIINGYIINSSGVQIGDSFMIFRRVLPYTPSLPNITSVTVPAPTTPGSYNVRSVYDVPFSVVPLPTVTVYANGSSLNQTISSGGSVNISWYVQNSASCTCTYTGGGSCGTSTGNGTKNATPYTYTLSQSRTFTVTCIN